MQEQMCTGHLCEGHKGCRSVSMSFRQLRKHIDLLTEENNCAYLLFNQIKS